MNNSSFFEISASLLSNFKMKIRKSLLRLFDSTCMHWKRRVIVTWKFITQFVYRNLNSFCLLKFSKFKVCRLFQLKYVIKLVLHSKKLENFNLYKTHFIRLFDSTCIPKCLIIITSKSKRIFPKKLYVLFAAIPVKVRWYY